jgi:Xaa-Pro aminopeptidase
MGDRRGARLAALREQLLSLHLDALLVTSLTNVRYLTGFSGSSGLLLVTPSGVVLFTDFRYERQVSTEVAADVRVQIESASLWSGLWAQLPSLAGLHVIGFESAHLMHRDFERLLKDGTRWQWRPTTDLVETQREIKDDDEVAAIVAAVGVAEQALDRVLREVRVGQSELEVAGRLEHALRDAGSDGFAFGSIVAGGPNAALPHARPSGRPLATGDLLLLDFGAIVDGYRSDITRTVVVGRASPEQREVYEVVREANARAIAGIRPGMTGADADRLAREYIADRGFGAEFGHGLGHGLGLDTHEGPRLSRTADAPLREGVVVTIEPGIYRAGWGGVRIEDDILLMPLGARVLTTYRRELIELV